MFYFGSYYYPVGISINDFNLKLAQLKRVAGKVDIQALNRVELPSGIVEEGEVKDMEKLIIHLKKLNNDPLFGQIRNSRAIASLPDTKTFIKRLKVSKTLNNIEESIENEMEKHIPFLLDKVYYDWQRIDEGKDNYSVLVGACPQKISDDYYHALSEAGFLVEALESEAVAICRSVLEGGRSTGKKNSHFNYLIIDLGGSKTTFIVYADGTIIFTTDIESSQKDIVEEISKKMNISRSKAKNIKNKYQKGGKSNSNVEVDKIVNNVFWEINKKINEIFGYYNNQIKGKGQIEHIKLVGEGVHYKDIKSLISSSQAEVERADPSIHLNVNKKKIRKKHGKNKKSSIYDYCLDFAASIGLSLNKVF